MKKALVPRLFVIILLLSATSFAADRFDGHWLTKLTSPPKGSTAGYTWEFPATIQNSNLIDSLTKARTTATMSKRSSRKQKARAPETKGWESWARPCEFEFRKQPVPSGAPEH